MIRREHVLVVDDEAGITIALRAVLEREGYTVSTALTAGEARRLIDTVRFDVALLDLRIRDEDGIELLNLLRARQPDCPAIILTGYATLDSALRAIRYGAYDYLTKPCPRDELKITIARAVEHGALTRQLREQLAELEAANTRIRSFADELHQRVDQATAELNQKVQELSEAKHSLEQSQQQREEFMSIVAHELAQPLTNIRGYAQLLDRPDVPEDVRQHAQHTIVAETARMTRLVQDLADAARLAAGQFQLHPEECDLVELARQQVELARTGADLHRLTFEAPDCRVIVRCDRDRIAQVLSNLLTNAIKYSPGGQIRTRISIDGGRICVTVRDDGPGIPADQLDAIFAPYVRLLGVCEREVKGSGLGLYVARGIAEAHGGRIWAESVEGQGATFTLCLPLGDEGVSSNRERTKDVQII